MGVAFDMTLFLVRRMAGFAATLFIATLVIFLLLDLLPGDPARFILGINATPEAVAALRTQMGLDAPAHERFLAWVGGMLVGDFGLSTTQRLPVAELIAERMAVTLPLSLIAMVVSVVVGLPIGILAAMRRGKATDTALMVLAQTGLAIPNFWFGMLLTLVFAVTLRWLPTGGFIPWDEDAGAAMRGMILPGLALALPQATPALVITAILAFGFAGAYAGTHYLRRMPEATFKRGFRIVLTAIAVYLLIAAAASVKTG